ncbi:MAG: Fic family protein, partial [Rhodococcus sp.]|nr:Fic family protein [Rhodococcus sp. (in: high G+C Gram-positive bacteria)]
MNTEVAMARLEVRRWAGDASGQTRRDRRPCDYEAYIPDPLVGRRFVLDGDVAADVADAEARLDAAAGALADTEALTRLLLRAEAVASSRI